MNSVVLVESQGSCALVRILRLQKFDRRDNMIFTVHLNRLIDENTPLEQFTIETCLQEAHKYQKVTKISCDIGSRFEASWLDCVTLMSEMTIAVIVVSASCHHLTWADSGWSRISWFSRVTLPWLRGGTSVAPWRHKWSHVPVFLPSVWPSSRSNFDLGPSPSDSTGKNSIISELMILECCFPLSDTNSNSKRRRFSSSFTYFLGTTASSGGRSSLWWFGEKSEQERWRLETSEVVWKGNGREHQRKKTSKSKTLGNCVKTQYPKQCKISMTTTVVCHLSFV